MRSFSKILEDLESWEQELSKSSRIFEKLFTVAENGFLQCPVQFQCPHNLKHSLQFFESVFEKRTGTVACYILVLGRRCARSRAVYGKEESLRLHGHNADGAAPAENHGK